MNSTLQLRRQLVAGLFLAASLFLAGCEPQQRPSEAAVIISNYHAFRVAVTNNDIQLVLACLGKDLMLAYSTNKTFGGYGGVFLSPKSELTTNAYVRFEGSNHAWLWPQSRPVIGAYGIGFVKENNVWKLEGNFTGVQD